MLSVVIPVLDAASVLGPTLDAVAGSPTSEVVVVDAGSTDGTVGLASSRGGRVVRSARGRGTQIAAGIAAARLPWLLLLHADTVLGSGWRGAALTHMRTGEGSAGFFRFALDSKDSRARRLERRVAWRCRALALPYGDQGLLIHRALLEAAGGMRPLPLMEDVDLVCRIGRGRLRALDAPAVTSAAKWERDGWRRRSARNVLCLSLYFAGLPPKLIARLYG